MTRSELLEEIASLALTLRSLERELLHVSNTRSVFDRLTLTRQMLDEALADLMRQK